jgi:Family of unknown function (DUF5825)
VTVPRDAGGPAPGHRSAADVRHLDGSSGALAILVAWLRDQMAAGVIERWTGVVADNVDTTLLHHLPPPEAAAAQTADTDPRLTAWTAAFRPALCYYRVGPGFIHVKDIRDPAASARLTLDYPAHRQLFLRCLRPTLVDDLTDAEHAAVAALTQERLLLIADGLAVTVPYRMRRWPIPARFA